MRKFFFLIVLVIFSEVASSQVVVGGVRRRGTSLDMDDKLKQRLKTDLKLTDSEADSVAMVHQNYSFKLRAVEMDTKISEQERKSQLSSLETARRGELQRILKKDQLQKLEGMRDKLHDRKMYNDDTKSADN